MLLCHWLASCPIAVTHFLHCSSNVPFVSFYNVLKVIVMMVVVVFAGIVVVIVIRDIVLMRILVIIMKLSPQFHVVFCVCSISV